VMLDFRSASQQSKQVCLTRRKEGEDEEPTEKHDFSALRAECVQRLRRHREFGARADTARSAIRFFSVSSSSSPFFSV